MKHLVGRKTVFVAMSGGVDSSVAALLLKQKGFEVVGVFMKNWSENIPGTVQCSTEADQQSARQVAAQLKIPFYTWDFEKQYRQLVFGPMVHAYANGLTPNPDVVCNQRIKFGLFLEKALKLGADYMATGHYVKKLKTKNLKLKTIYKLAVAKDKNKDQSYFLWTLNQDQLQYCLFPIGDYLKPRVRQIAKTNGLITADRKDSQGLCFVGKVDFANFLEKYLPGSSGKIMAVSKNSLGQYIGQVIGSHPGLHFFTLGQRQGIGIGGGLPYYAAAKDAVKNYLYVANKDMALELFPPRVKLNQVNFISGLTLNKKQKFLVRYRYRQLLSQAVIEPGPNQTLTVDLGKNSFGVTPGQSMVFYQGRTMIGGGVIEPINQKWLDEIVI
jgi:tRNA-specific 2-thiouridylase